MKLFEAGQEITTKIAGISGDYIFLDLNAKSEGILDRSEFAKEDGSTAVQVGDTVSVFFLKEENGELYFTTKIDSKKADAALIENAWKSGIPIDGHVEKEIKGGFEVKIGGARAFCPYSQMGYRQKEDSSFYIGKTLPFIIREYRDSGRSLLVSNRAYMEAEEKTFALKENISIPYITLRALSVDIGYDCPGYGGDFGEKIRAVMKDGSEMTLMAQWCGLDFVRYFPDSPMMIDQVDHLIFEDGTVIPAS